MSTTSEPVAKLVTDPAVDPLMMEFRKATAIEPALPDLERYVANQDRGDLPAVESWVIRFNQLLNGNQQLKPFGKAVFAYLITLHNKAITNSQESKR